MSLVISEPPWNTDWADTLSANSTLVLAEQTGWAEAVAVSNLTSIHLSEWYIECALAGSQLWRAAVTIDPEIRGGRPVLIGTGFTVAQTLAELSESSGVSEVAENFQLEESKIRDVLDSLSLLFERSFSR
jgi:uncharacterized protein (DUF433 family)